jgi:hypothetical protein
MLILLISGLVIVIGLCMAIDRIVASFPVQRDEVLRQETYTPAQAQAAFIATVKQEDHHALRIQQAASKLIW